MKLPKLHFSKPVAADQGIFPIIKLTTGAPGLFVEVNHQMDYVFGDGGPRIGANGYCLATYDAAGRRLSIYFIPKGEKHEAALHVYSNGHNEICYELPELGQRANYRQVSTTPQYLAVRDTLRTAAKARGRSGGMPLWGVALLVGLGLLSSILLFSSPSQTVATIDGGPPIMAPVKPSVSSAPQLSNGSQLTADEQLVLAKVVNDSGIELTTGGKPFVIFSDPNCPACRQLEQNLATLDSSLSPVIVPVSFKPGSAEAVAGVLCSPGVADAWRTAASGGGAPPACAKGEAQANSNNAAFRALQFNVTPTIVTSAGKVAIGGQDFAGLMKWVKENSK